MGQADKQFEKAELAVKKQNLDYAIALYQQGLILDPAAAEALLDAAGYPRRADGNRFEVTYDLFEPWGNDAGPVLCQSACRVRGGLTHAA